MKTYEEVKKNEESEKANRRRENKARWLPFARYWILYLFLALTAILSSFAGVYIGIAPDSTGQIMFIDSWDAARRVFFAILFLSCFVLTAEGATLFWETKLVYHDVDENGKSNKVQLNTAKIALGVSIFTVIITGLAASRFIAAWAGSLSAFVTVPKAAQEWVVWSIPLLLVYHAASAILYWYHSADAKLSRYKNQVIRQTQAQMSQIESAAFIEEYQKTAPELARKRGIERARQMAEDDFYHREVAEGKDLNGDGQIGRPIQRHPAAMPAMATDVKREQINPTQGREQENRP